VTRPQLCVSVVTFNNASVISEFLVSLSRQDDVTADVHFFDNASTDGTPELLAQYGMGTVHGSAENIGYSRGHNRNLAGSTSELVLFLNADVTFGAGVFASLARFMEASPKCGIAGPRVLEGHSRAPFPPRYFYPGEGTIGLERGLARSEIAWLNGCCMIARRDMLEELGGFDEDFFLYQSETDLCLRARRAGHRIALCDDAEVWHSHRDSQRGSSEYDYGRRLFEGNAIFWEKHYPARDVARIARFQYRLSRLLLNVGGVFRRLSSFERALEPPRLRARRDVARECHERNAAQLSSGLASPRILFRQLQIAIEWARTGNFPLDDY
jgi:GT2 family glycosyltransferase